MMNELLTGSFVIDVKLSIYGWNFETLLGLCIRFVANCTLLRVASW